MSLDTLSAKPAQTLDAHAEEQAQLREELAAALRDTAAILWGIEDVQPIVREAAMVRWPAAGTPLFHSMHGDVGGRIVAAIVDVSRGSAAVIAVLGESGCDTWPDGMPKYGEDVSWRMAVTRDLHPALIEQIVADFTEHAGAIVALWS